MENNRKREREKKNLWVNPTGHVRRLTFTCLTNVNIVSASTIMTKITFPTDYPANTESTEPII